MLSVDPESALTQLQTLLYGLFRFDTADLDFGLYRLLKIKAAEVRAFIEQQLPAEVGLAFQDDLPAPVGDLRAQLREARNALVNNVGDQALHADGTINEDFLERMAVVPIVVKLAESYRMAWKALQQQQASEEKKLQVFNALYNFFRRYYDSGDFVPRRYYGTSEAYVMPYNGEETSLYWSSKGQHYVKTGERLRDYSFTVNTLEGERRMRFQLATAETPKENLKGKTRFYLPLAEQVRYDDPTGTLFVPFAYRLPTEEETRRYGTNSVGQEAILQAAIPEILARAPELLRPVLAQITAGEGENRPAHLLRHLRLFVKRQTTDYFIHPNLAEFLNRELEFYLKDQVFTLGDALAADLVEKQRSLRVTRRMGQALITFLAEMEGVENRLFEKRKLVLRRDYLVPVQNVPRELWPEILANAAQLDHWRALFALTGDISEATLERYPTLVVNTACFSDDFQWRLLASFEDIDAATDGILIHSENYQALNFLRPRFAGDIKCIYIDPPYNTGSDDFPYKDRYQHATWMTMMEERLTLAREMMGNESVIFASIADHEFAHLRLVMDTVFDSGNMLGNLIWKNATDNNPTRVAVEHEYILSYAKNAAKLPSEWKSSYSAAKEMMLDYYDSLIRKGLPLPKIQKLFREFIKDNAEIIGELERYKLVDEDGPYTGSESVHNPHPNGYDYEILHPITQKPMRKPVNGYRFPWETMKRDFIDKDRLIYGPDENRIVKIKVYLKEYLDSLRSVITIDGRLGSYTLASLFGPGKSPMDNPKSVELIERLLSFATASNDQIWDFFAGSGTTVHAIINMNRADGGSRKFTAIEMGSYFDTVLLPRVQKVMFCPEWKNGRPDSYPQRTLLEWPTWVKQTPKIVQVLHLEFFEDSLHNLSTEATLRREAPWAAAHKEIAGDNQYRLRYLARLPLEANAAMLVTDDGQLSHPFDYTLETLSDHGPVVQHVDLITTFNYLHGLHVERLHTWRNPADGDRLYRVVVGHKQGRRELVIWRDMAGLNPEVERAFLEERLNGYDQVWINGNTAALRAVHSIDAEFKRLLEDASGGGQ